MKIRFDFPYAQPALAECVLPEERVSAVYRMSDVHEPPDVQKEIVDSLRDPIGSPRLSELVRGKKRIALLVDDLTRSTPVGRIVPHVLKELVDVGVRKQQVTIVVALGSHRPMTKHELAERLGETIMQEYRVINSRFDRMEDLAYLGTAEDGVPVYVDKEVAGADFKIGVGSIVPHGAVGWSGGAKIIYPGVAGHDTVMRFHFAHGITEENMTGRDDCPIRLRMERWADMVGLDFIVNAIVTPGGDVYKVVAGHYREAHRRGIDFAKEVYQVTAKEKVDIVISSSYPHHTDFWQAAKGIYGPEALVRDGGTILLIAPCPEGVGPHPEFLERIGRDDNKAILTRVMNGELSPPQDPISLAPAAMLSRMRRRFKCRVVSSTLSEDQLGRASYERVEDVQSAVDSLLTTYPNGKVALVMHSDLTFQV